MFDTESDHIFQWKQCGEFVHVDVGDDAVFRDSRIKGIVVRTEQALLFSSDVQEDKRALRRNFHAGECPRDLNESRGARGIVVSAVVDVVTLIGGTNAKMVEMSGVDEVFVF